MELTKEQKLQLDELIEDLQVSEGPMSFEDELFEQLIPLINKFLTSAYERGQEDEREHIKYVFEHIEPNATAKRVVEYIEHLSAKVEEK